ncbi:MAG: hypothetical protein IIW79_00500 [Clostridia bacterium]|nr:hypothetical protein [Clostridia bacterium]
MKGAKRIVIDTIVMAAGYLAFCLFVMLVTEYTTIIPLTRETIFSSKKYATNLVTVGLAIATAAGISAVTYNFGDRKRPGFLLGIFGLCVAGVVIWAASGSPTENTALIFLNAPFSVANEFFGGFPLLLILSAFLSLIVYLKARADA